MKREVTIPMSHIADGVFVNLKVTGLRRWNARWWIALQLLRIAAWAAPASVEIEIEASK